MNTDSLRLSLRSAWERKRPLLAESDALRLLNGAASGTPGLTAELYGPHLVAYDYDGSWTETLKAAAPDLTREFAWKSLLIKDRSRPGDGDRGKGMTASGNPPESFFVRERELFFKVELGHPRNVGLFLDTRELRTELRGQARGKRVLNLFSYTCSLGLAALAGGAEEVVNVDISGRYSRWGRENLLRNALPMPCFRFKCMDAERYLDWADGKKISFDHVILDPPSFSRFDGSTFRFEDDYFRLAAKSVSRLVPGGTLYAATNFSEINASEFSRRLEAAVDSAGRRPLDLRRIPLPPDFDLAPHAEQRPEGNALIFQVGAG